MAPNATKLMKGRRSYFLNVLPAWLLVLVKGDRCLLLWHPSWEPECHPRSHFLKSSGPCPFICDCFKAPGFLHFLPGLAPLSPFTAHVVCRLFSMMLVAMIITEYMPGHGIPYLKSLYGCLQERLLTSCEARPVPSSVYCSTCCRCFMRQPCQWPLYPTPPPPPPCEPLLRTLLWNACPLQRGSPGAVLVSPPWLRADSLLCSPGPALGLLRVCKSEGIMSHISEKNLVQLKKF